MYVYKTFIFIYLRSVLNIPYHILIIILAVDCVWGDWSVPTCNDTSCGSIGNMMQKREKEQEALNEGIECDGEPITFGAKCNSTCTGKT